jgi:CBS domain-containing protein
VLRTMVQHNLPAVAVVSPDGRLIGLVERDQLVSDLLLDLTSGDADD